MASRVVLFGATGFTGRLTAEALVRRGIEPVLAGRSRERLRDASRALGGLPWELACAAEPATLADLLGPGDVLVSTVGPFARWGASAATAAISKGANYFDSTGEGTFVREVFERFGPQAQAANCALLTAFGSDWVPGNLAGALVLREAGAEAVRVQIGYFITGRATRSAVSGGTRASMASEMFAPGFAWQDAQMVSTRAGAQLAYFDVDGRRRPAVSASGSEHFALPALAPGLRDVDVYLGWFGALSRPLRLIGGAAGAAVRVPGVAALTRRAGERLIRGSTGGPNAGERAKTGVHVVAIARDRQGRQLAGVHMAGINAYEFTAAILAWGIATALGGGLRGHGALGPVQAFGLENLQAGATEAGLHRV
jgi:short subunit dehydrogenase-like uncharacterized protein